MIYLGAKEWYFYEGIKAGRFKQKQLKLPVSLNELQEYYDFGYDLGKVLTKEEFLELQNCSQEYMELKKEKYTKTVLNKGEKYAQ